MATMAIKDQRLAVRLTSRQRRRLDQAAGVRGQSLTEFCVQAALDRADEVMADQSVIILDDAEWDSFNQALDQPGRVLPGLARLIDEPSVFE